MWEVSFCSADMPKLLEIALAEGWEPYAAVVIPGAGVVHYLRRRKKGPK